MSEEVVITYEYSRDGVAFFTPHSVFSTCRMRKYPLRINGEEPPKEEDQYQLIPVKKKPQ